MKCRIEIVMDFLIDSSMRKRRQLGKYKCDVVILVYEVDLRDRIQRF